MRKFITRSAVLLVVCALSMVMALAAAKTKKVTFLTDVTINGTVVKKGTYQVTFDEKTGDLVIMDKKTVVAKANARMEKFAGVPGTVYVTESNKELVGIVFNNSQATLGSGGNASTSAQ
jgi:hypothetical protein